MPLLWLYILLGILLLFALICLIPLRIKVLYQEKFFCYLYIGFVRLTLFPQKPKKKKPQKPKKAKKKSNKKSSDNKKEKNLLQKKGISGIIKIIKRVARLAQGVLKDFFKRVKVSKFMLSVKVVGEDAADTAVKYGYCCSAIYPSFGIIVRAVDCKKYGVDVLPDFTENAQTHIFLEFDAKVRLFWLVNLVFKHGIKGLMLLLDINKGE